MNTWWPFHVNVVAFAQVAAARRMAETAIHLVDEVLPVKPIRQWVFSFPIQIRLLLAIRPKIMTEILNIVTKTISQHLCKKAGFKRTSSKTGTSHFNSTLWWIYQLKYPFYGHMQSCTALHPAAKTQM